MLSPELQQLLHHGGWECSGKLRRQPSARALDTSEAPDQHLEEYPCWNTRIVSRERSPYLI